MRPTNFLFQFNLIESINSISVNDNKVLLYQSDCTFSIKEKSELTGVDSDELDSLKALIHSHGNIYDYLINDNEASREIFDPTNLSNSESKHTIIRDSEKRKINLYKYASSDSVQHKNGEFSIPGPFEHLARTFQQGKFVTYVYNDGFVLMKPSWCQTVDDINSLYPQPIANNLLNPTSFVNPMIQPNFGWTNQI